MCQYQLEVERQHQALEEKAMQLEREKLNTWEIATNLGNKLEAAMEEHQN